MVYECVRVRFMIVVVLLINLLLSFSFWADLNEKRHRHAQVTDISVTKPAQSQHCAIDDA